MSQFNKQPLELQYKSNQSLSTDNNLKYLQTIQEKENTIQILLKSEESLKQQIQVHLIQIEEFKNNLKRMRKLEQTNIKLKAMLKESQDFILNHQQEIQNYQTLYQTLINITSHFKLNENITLLQRLKFLQEQVFNFDILQDYGEILLIQESILQSLKITTPIKVNDNLIKKYLSTLHYHPMSTITMLQKILQSLVRVLPKDKTRILAFNSQANQFIEQIKQISCYQTNVNVITQEEEYFYQQNKELKSKIKQIQDELLSSQNEIITLKQQIQELNVQNTKLQSETNAMKESQRKPFVELLSSSSEDSQNDLENQIEILKENLKSKDELIIKQQKVNSQLAKQLNQENKDIWDLIIECKDIQQLIDSFWQFNFISDQGIIQHNYYISFSASNSHQIQRLLEPFQQQFQFNKLHNQSYSQLLNQDLIYLKNMDESCLFSIKIFDNNSVQRLANEDLWIKFVLINGILIINDQNNELIDLSCKIQQSLNKLKTYIIIITDNENYIRQGFTLYNMEQQQQIQQQTNIILQWKDLSIERLLKIISESRQNEFVGMFRDYLQNNIGQYIELNDDPQFDLQEIDDQTYNLSLKNDQQYLKYQKQNC